jgi:hypothetical protein
MVATFGGGALGSLAGTLAWTVRGWRGVCELAAVLVIAAGVTLLVNRKHEAEHA